MSVPDLRATDLTVSRLTQRDIAALTELCLACSPFFQMTEGKSGSRLIAEEILELMAPGKSADAKHLLGISRDGSLIAVADLAEDYPSESDWYVALFLVTPTSRQCGLGTRIWAAIESWIRQRGGKRIGLIVQRQNPDARRFWERQGFAMVEETIQRLPDRENRVWRMLKSDSGAVRAPT
jgi:GNAT superfamily N-acetyltransferase